MSFLWRVIKTQVMRRQLMRYREAKMRSDIPQYRERTKKKNRLQLLYESMQTENTPESLLWASTKGFIGGVLLSWMFFAFCIVAFRMPLKQVTWTSSAIATMLSFLLSFSSIARCYVLLLLPQLFSKRGRQAITAYAFLLAVSGPAGNAVHNLGVLSNSLACGQEQIKRCMRQVVEMIKEPITSLKVSLKKLQENIKEVVKPIKDVVTRITRAFKAIFGVIKSVTAWLGSIVSVCNKKTGTPYQRCVQSLDDAIADCQVKLGIMQWLCSVVSAVKPICLPAKVVDVMCIVVNIVSDTIVEVAKRRLSVFRQHVIDLLAVSIEIQHSLNMTDTTSRSIRDIVKSVVAQVEKRSEKIKFLFKISIAVPGFAFIFLLLKLFHYRHKFLTKDHFDNRYINRQLVEIDLARIKRNLPTVLPLELSERKLYTSASSLRLVRGERKRLLSAFLFLMIATVQVCIYLAVDYGIYWTLLKIRKQGLDSGLSLDMPQVGMKVQGKGTMADLYKRLGEAFRPPAPFLELDPVPCLPEPLPPDFRCYSQIGVLLTLGWLLALAEPFSLRLRHIVMSKYHPERAKQRAVWLHNHILLSRGPFTVFARGQMLSRTRNAESYSTGTFYQRMIHRSIILRKIFGNKIVACAICASSEKSGEKLMECFAMGCKAKYCHFCLQTLPKCTLCYETLRSSVHDDVMWQAIDSSDDELTEEIESILSQGEEADIDTYDSDERE